MGSSIFAIGERLARTSRLISASFDKARRDDRETYIDRFYFSKEKEKEKRDKGEEGDKAGGK